MAERTPASELTVMTGADPGALATTIERLAATYTAPPWVEEMGRARREFGRASCRERVLCVV